MASRRAYPGPGAVGRPCPCGQAPDGPEPGGASRDVVVGPASGLPGGLVRGPGGLLDRVACDALADGSDYLVCAVGQRIGPSPRSMSVAVRPASHVRVAMYVSRAVQES